MRRRSGRLWMVLLPAAGIGYQWLVHAIIVDAETMSVRTTLAALNGIAHAAINVFLAWVFGRTLARGREPLITSFARRIHGSVPAYIESYTARVTAAWCVFFAAQVVVSASLLVAAPLAAWSFFVNVVSFPLVAVMFVAEYLYRIVRFRDHAHATIWQGVDAFIRHARDARSPEAPSQNR